MWLLMARPTMRRSLGGRNGIDLDRLAIETGRAGAGGRFRPGRQAELVNLAQCDASRLKRGSRSVKSVSRNE